MTSVPFPILARLYYERTAQPGAPLWSELKIEGFSAAMKAASEAIDKDPQLHSDLFDQATLVIEEAQAIHADVRNVPVGRKVRSGIRQTPFRINSPTQRLQSPADVNHGRPLPGRPGQNGK
jgi:hypothetical protein